MATLTGRARRAVRAYGRRVALRHLVVVAGMQVLERGWQCGAGRIDVVARDGDKLVFCSVVASVDGMSDGEGPEPSAPVTASALRPMAQLWLAKAGLVDALARYDVVSVAAQARGAAHVRHDRGVG